jgi:hypothetical protein
MAPDLDAPWAAAGPGDRAAYLAQMSELLWPGPRLGSGAVTAEFRILPGSTRPRLIVPPGRRAAAAAVRRYGEPGSRKTLLATRGLALLLRAGLGGAVLRDRLRIRLPAGTPTIETYLRHELGVDVRVSMHLGAPRANRKPVLQLVTPEGVTVGFAKIGVNALTRELVGAEHAALAQLGEGRPAGLSVPGVLHFGRWADLDVLVQSPLPVWERRTPLAAARLATAMTEVTGVGGRSRQGLGASGYWRQLGARVGAADDTAARSDLAAALRRVEAAVAGDVLSFGGSHGDWTPWNMASARSGLYVWDWERFRTGVPVGFDATHYWLQEQVVGRRADPRAAAAECVDRAAALLGPLGVAAGEARLTALLYLADLAARYLTDRQAEGELGLGDPGRWLIPVLTAGLSQLPVGPLQERH